MECCQSEYETIHATQTDALTQYPFLSFLLLNISCFVATAFNVEKEPKSAQQASGQINLETRSALHFAKDCLLSSHHSVTSHHDNHQPTSRQSTYCSPHYNPPYLTISTLQSPIFDNPHRCQTTHIYSNTLVHDVLSVGSSRMGNVCLNTVGAFAMVRVDGGNFPLGHELEDVSVPRGGE